MDEALAYIYEVQFYLLWIETHSKNKNIKKYTIEYFLSRPDF